MPTDTEQVIARMRQSLGVPPWRANDDLRFARSIVRRNDLRALLDEIERLRSCGPKGVDHGRIV